VVGGCLAESAIGAGKRLLVGDSATNTSARTNSLNTLRRLQWAISQIKKRRVDKLLFVSTAAELRSDDVTERPDRSKNC
jgi:hypothetical protein